MNLSTVAMLLLAWQLLSGGNDKGETMTDKLGAMLSDDSAKFFSEIDNVADAEVKSKLYKWYDWQYRR